MGLINEKSTGDEQEGGGTAVRNLVWDLHLELLTTYHRICLKSISFGRP